MVTMWSRKHDKQLIFLFNKSQQSDRRGNKNKQLFWVTNQKLNCNARFNTIF